MAYDINDDNMIAIRIPETDYFTPDTFIIENANHDSNFLLVHKIFYHLTHIHRNLRLIFTN